MRKLINFISKSQFLVGIVAIVCAVFGATSVMAEAVNPAGGGAVSQGTIVTRQWVDEVSQELNLNTVERKVIKIRPMANPLEHLARLASRRASISPTYEYYTTDVLDVDATTTEAIAAGGTSAVLKTNKNNIFSKYETLICHGVYGYKEDEKDVQSTEEELLLYVVNKGDGGALTVMPVNGKGATNAFPQIPSGTKITRAGRAHHELDAQTSPYATAPTKSHQYLQTFMAQIEESTLQKIADKEADWNFSDLEEEAIFDMKRGMNKSYWKGAGRKLRTTEGKEIYMTKGIWYQTDKKFVYGASSSDLAWTADTLIDFAKTVFCGNASGKRKTFLCGSELMANISKIKTDKVQVNDNTKVRFGLEFREIATNFGTLEVILDESLDELGMAKCGMVVDVEYFRKPAIQEMKVADLDLKTSGQRNADARTITEISALILQNPNAHCKVVPNNA